ncbi:KAP family P-loop domain protein [Xanthomonas sp. SS]|uniref:KAP family P-loop NTPase fold protein n=1 Tax=Xanthomonas sp. SS TaxID=2724122 RepID=UPI00163A3D52|nr:P-loop NTPase fold protein [Xanthomonas sp. SS]QNH17740.1 KAP family P-loop domain protein [Xanthomonas sp. SS]
MTALLRKPKHPSIDSKNAWKGDPFNRKRDAEVLCRLIASSTADPIVISLQSPWGTGKTTFLRRLATHIDSEFSIPTIIVDAWKNDSFDDPLEAITTELIASLDEKKKRSKSDSKKAMTEKTILKIAKHSWEVLRSTSAPAAEAIYPGSGQVIAPIAEIADQWVENQRSKREALPKFKETLIEIRDTLTSRTKNRPILPILLIIDELDRCRPDYAIKMLERIKHYFDVAGVTFLIATDRGNLPSAVNTVYGSHVDGELYLRKFFDFEFHLPPPSKEVYAIYLASTYILPYASPDDALSFSTGINRHAIEESFNYLKIDDIDKAAYQLHFPSMANAMDLSLRDQSQALTMLAAFIHSREDNPKRLPVIDCFISCIRFSCPQFFNELINDQSFTPIPNDAPQSRKTLFASIGRTAQWAAIEKFFSRPSTVMVMFDGDMRRSNDEETQPWERMASSLKRGSMATQGEFIIFDLAMRMKRDFHRDPFSYALNFVRLTPPTLKRGNSS